MELDPLEPTTAFGMWYTAQNGPNSARDRFFGGSSRKGLRLSLGDCCGAPTDLLHVCLRSVSDAKTRDNAFRYVCFAADYT